MELANQHTWMGPALSTKQSSKGKAHFAHAGFTPPHPFKGGTAVFQL